MTYPFDLTKREFDILFLLAATPGRVYTYEQIYRIIEDEAVPDSKTEGLIQNAKGVGYYFQRPNT